MKKLPLYTFLILTFLISIAEARNNLLTYISNDNGNTFYIIENTKREPLIFIESKELLKDFKSFYTTNINYLIQLCHEIDTYGKPIKSCSD